MRVPDSAATGKAKVTFSFDAWPQGRVQPTTIELPIVAPKPKVETDDEPKNKAPAE